MTIDPLEPSPSLEPTEEDERAARAARIMEAVIFASGRPVNAETLAEQLQDGDDIEAGLARLAAHYRHRGIHLVKVAGGWTFRTAPDLAEHLTVHRVVRRRLSRAALETLAIIAYHQPVTRAEVEEIRGVHPRAGYARPAAGGGLDRAEGAPAHTRPPRHLGHNDGVHGALRPGESRRPARSRRA